MSGGTLFARKKAPAKKKEKKAVEWFGTQ